MAYIRQINSSKFRAEIKKNNKSITTKTFSTRKAAEKWSSNAEKQIENILQIPRKKLKKLTPEKVKKLGGIEIFQRLGIDIKFLTFAELANEYMMKEWKGKDPFQGSRVSYWIKYFEDSIGFVDENRDVLWNKNRGNLRNQKRRHQK